MAQTSNLNEIKAECDRIVQGMLNGSMTHDDGLFATAATLTKLVTEFSQFVAYALPIVHTVHQAMLAAQQQAAQAQAMQATSAQASMQVPQTAQAQAAQQAPMQAQAQAPMQAQAAPPQDSGSPTNVVPFTPPSGDVQVVDGVPRVRP